MITTYGCATLIAFAATAAPTPPKKVPKPKAKPAVTAKKATTPEEGQRLVGLVEGYYKKIDDYSADFIQTYTRVALSKTSETRGKLTIKKPGLMKWAYQKPAEKLWIVDGKKLWVADPEEMQVFVDESYQTSELTSSIRFLWGDGKLGDNFVPRLGTQKDAKDVTKGSGVLVLTPKSGASYNRLVLVVDSKTGEVRSSTIYETAGNTNHFKFKNVQVNRGIPASDFAYEPPKNWEVIYR